MITAPSAVSSPLPATATSSRISTSGTPSPETTAGCMTRRLRSVDVDAFITAHRGEWQRLETLAGRRRLDGAEADELVSLYRQVATHLALVQARAPEPQLVAQLSRLLARGRAAAVGTPRTRG